MNLKNLLEPLEDLIETQAEQIELVVTKNNVLEKQIQSLSKALTASKAVNHSLNMALDVLSDDDDEWEAYDDEEYSCDPEYDDDEIEVANEEFQYASDEKEDCTEDCEETGEEYEPVEPTRVVVPVIQTVDSVIARALIKFDSVRVSHLSVDDLIKLAEFKRIWNSTQ